MANVSTMNLQPGEFALYVGIGSTDAHLTEVRRSHYGVYEYKPIFSLEGSGSKTQSSANIRRLTTKVSDLVRENSYQNVFYYNSIAYGVSTVTEGNGNSTLFNDALFHRLDKTSTSDDRTTLNRNYQSIKSASEIDSARSVTYWMERRRAEVEGRKLECVEGIGWEGTTAVASKRQTVGIGGNGTCGFYPDGTEEKTLKMKTYKTGTKAVLNLNLLHENVPSRETRVAKQARYAALIKDFVAQLMQDDTLEEGAQIFITGKSRNFDDQLVLQTLKSALVEHDRPNVSVHYISIEDEAIGVAKSFAMKHPNGLGVYVPRNFLDRNPRMFLARIDQVFKYGETKQKIEAFFLALGYFLLCAILCIPLLIDWSISNQKMINERTL